MMAHFSKRELLVAEHDGISCDHCGAMPIMGIRYKCGNCIDFDLCERCFLDEQQQQISDILVEQEQPSEKSTAAFIQVSTLHPPSLRNFRTTTAVTESSAKRYRHDREHTFVALTRPAPRLRGEHQQPLLQHINLYDSSKPGWPITQPPNYSFQKLAPPTWGNDTSPSLANSSRAIQAFVPTAISGTPSALLEGIRGKHPVAASGMAESSLNRFAVTLFARLLSNNASNRQMTAQGGQSNVVFSPVSIWISLVILANGASGETFREIIAAIFLQSQVNPEREGDLLLTEANDYTQRLLDLAKASSQRLACSSGIIDKVPVFISIANGLWLDASQRSSVLSPQALAILQDNFNTEFFLPTSGRISASEVNGWISAKTMGKISEILASNMPLTDMLIVNALYFKAQWKTKFDTSLSSPGLFFNSPLQSPRQVTMMKRTALMQYYGDDEVQIVELEYESLSPSLQFADSAPTSAWSAIIILPAVQSNLQSIASKVFLSQDARWMPAVFSLLSSGDPHKHGSVGGRHKISLSLPRFTLRLPAMDIGRVLQGMGMKSAFESSRADFSRFFGSETRPQSKESFFVSQMLHEAVLEVDESGTVGAAVTVTAMFGSAAPPAPPIEMTVNRPFFFVVVEKESLCPLFMAQVAEP